MIQIYAPNNTNFDVNSDVLLPTSCIVSAEINGTWQLTLTHAIDEDERWRNIVDTAVIKVKSFNGEQLFRIKHTEKQDSGITAIAEPIFLDAIGDCFLYDVRPTNMTGQQALDRILSANSKYSGTTDITKRATAYYVLKNAVEAIAGGENAFIERWGGEIIYDNFNIIINEEAGSDNNVELLYAKNIPVDGLIESVNVEDIVTRIIPKAYNGYLITGNTQYVNSPIINSYPTIHTKVVEYDYIRLAEDVGEEEDTSDLIICQNRTQMNTALRTEAQKDFANGIDKPAVSISCDMILLQNTEEYKDFADLEKVSLGDTIHCKHSKLDIVTDARIVSLEWDCITESVTSVVIGEAQPNIMNRLTSVVTATEKAITKDGNIIAEQVEGFINGAKAQLRLQNTTAEKQNVHAILFEDLDPQSATYGALAIGTQGLQVSRTRSGDKWVWGTAITSEGIIANYVVAGILSDKNSINYWNLDTGEFRLSASTTVGGQTVQQIATTIANGAVSAQTQQDIFNKLTNNGASQGIYLNNGQLYINGTYIQAGQINANLITAGTIKDAQNKNSWNLTTGALSTSGAVVSGGSITGASINNGSGTFQVDADGNLKASSAEITGAIKSGSTITGAKITQLNGTNKAVELDDRLIQFYNWANNQKLVGAIGTIAGTYAGLFNVFFQKGGRLMIYSSTTDTIDLSSMSNFEEVAQFNGGTNKYLSVNGYISAQNGFTANGSSGVTRTVTISGVTLTIKGGIITSVT